jgi:hypothetical protein
VAKLSKAQVKKKADEWFKVGKQIEKAEKALATDLRPFEEKFEKDTAPVRERHDAKIQKLYDKQAELNREVIEWLEGQGKVISVAGDVAIAESVTKIGSRVIDPQKYLDKAKDKGVAMWDAVTIMIAKAEKLLGKKTIDEISTKETKLVASLRSK